MSDTSPTMMKKMSQLMSEKSPQDRLRMGSSMFDFSRELVLTALKLEYPDNLQEQRRGFFLRFYGSEFPEEIAKRIADHVAGWTDGAGSA